MGEEGGAGVWCPYIYTWTHRSECEDGAKGVLKRFKEPSESVGFLQREAVPVCAGAEALKQLMESTSVHLVSVIVGHVGFALPSRANGIYTYSL